MTALLAMIGQLPLHGWAATAVVVPALTFAVAMYAYLFFGNWWKDD